MSGYELKLLQNEQLDFAYKSTDQIERLIFHGGKLIFIRKLKLPAHNMFNK